ncbi:MAG: HEAT repeat domain-containing protein [Chloroflexi bacterium]|uniref:HEAT repeat domain-containing protein n=1 Tax=Candidatus Chlorohelix allophototropha TaxID=3003348 RepID=A0A8T7LZX6_9CHLR|nr:HEAT repeat domain-containing protein [Chloroflexota bacterium]WJW66462.1 HEAT repeat domain-containing protein [Chloroflexota bacterium L227-S17]
MDDNKRELIMGKMALVESADPTIRERTMVEIKRLTHSMNKDTSEFLNSELVVSSLVKALKDANPKVRNDAALIMSNLSNKRLVEPLTKALHKDTNLQVRIACIIALGAKGLRTHKTLPLMIKLLRTDKEADIREFAAANLGKIKDVFAIEPLTQAINENLEESGILSEIALALGSIGDERALEPLLQLSKFSDDNVREFAVEALGDVKSPQALDRLVEIVLDQTEIKDVRGRAIESIEKIGILTPDIQKVLESVLGDMESYADRNWHDNKLGEFAQRALKKLQLGKDG